MCDQQRLRSACAYAQSDQNICSSLEYFMSVRLLTEHYLEFLSLKGGCTGSSESILVKMPHCWKSHVTAHFYFLFVSVSQKLDTPNQTAEYLGKQNQIVWKINKLPGKTETVAQFRVGLLQPCNYQFSNILHLKISCQKHKIGSLLLSSRYM